MRGIALKRIEQPLKLLAGAIHQRARNAGARGARAKVLATKNKFNSVFADCRPKAGTSVQKTLSGDGSEWPAGRTSMAT